MRLSYEPWPSAMNEEMLNAFRDAIDSAETVAEVDDVAGSLPGEEYEEALSDKIEEKRSELQAERIDPNSMTRAELADLLQNRPELRSAASEILDASEEGAEDRKPDSGSGSDPDRVEDEPDPGSSPGAPESADDSEQTDSEHNWEVGGDRGLDTVGDTSDDWDGDAAYDEILSWAEDEDGNVDQSEAQRGFAVYDADAEGDAEADYKGPYATVEDGELKADMAGVDALDSMLGQMDVSEDKKDSVQDLVDSYKDDAEGSEDQTQDVGDIEVAIQDAIQDDLEDKVSFQDGVLSVEGELMSDSALNTLIDTAERLGVEVGEEPDAEDLVASINQRASQAGSTTDTTGSAPDAWSLFQRLEDHGARL